MGVPDPALFPAATWRRLVAGQLRNTRITGGYADPAGHPALRTAIARYVGVSRAVRVTADDVLVTNGAQQALDLVGRVLVGPGDVVAVEEPGHPPARRLFESLGARVVGVPVDVAGIDVEALPPQARLVYVTPSHQFPLGTPCHSPAGAPCSPGPAITTPRSSRTTTTPSTGSPTGRSTRCTHSTAADG